MTEPLDLDALVDRMLTQAFVSGQMDAQGHALEKWKIGSGGPVLALSKQSYALAQENARSLIAHLREARLLADGHRADSALVDEFEADGLTLRAGAQTMSDLKAEITFAEFSRVNRLRCESLDGFRHQLTDWSTSDWFVAILGELGEAANVAKKLNRVRDGIPGNKETPEQLAAKLQNELADAFVYLDLLAQSLGFSIGEAAVAVFNAKSAEIGSPHRMTDAPKES